MRFLIVGAGFTGLSCAVDLLEAGHSVEIWEKDNVFGGLAGGFRSKNWNWSLERYYHHVFANDREIIELANKVEQKIIWSEPETSSLIKGKQHPLDSPTSLLRFEGLRVEDRLKMGIGLAVLKTIPNGRFLERYRVVDVLPILVGKNAYESIWMPLLKAKFNRYLDKVNMAWFWARVYKRTKKLGYFENGFASFGNKLVAYIEKKGGVVKLGKKIESLDAETKRFDRVLLTVPAPVLSKITGGKLRFPKLDYLWGQTMVLEMNRSLMSGYWLNILEKDWPFLVAVEHTNLIDKSRYNGKTILYLGNYLDGVDTRLKMSDEKLFALYEPFLKKINSEFKKVWVDNIWRFQDNFAQPVFPVNYSSKLPEIKTKVDNLYIANMSMVYPWDRGTNYAVKLGGRVAKKMIKK